MAAEDRQGVVGVGAGRLADVGVVDLRARHDPSSS
jgi:hypothetical protein